MGILLCCLPLNGGLDRSFSRYCSLIWNVIG
jgi:hypothetical protein